MPQKEMEELEAILQRLKPTQYRLLITEVVLDWYGNVGLGNFIKTVSAEEFEQISKDPLRDYASFGVQAVLYVDISASPVYSIDYYTVQSSDYPIHIEKYDERLKHQYSREIEKVLENEELFDTPFQEI